MATLLLILIYIAFIGLGLPDALLGAAWPVAHIDLGASVSQAGFVSVVVTCGTVLSSLLSARIIKRFGTGLATAVSVFLTAGALMAMRFVNQFYMLVLLALPLGLGAGTVDTALNAYVALHYRSSHMQWLHCFWGVGATAGPVIVALYLKRGDWRGAYQSVAIALCCIAALLFCALPLWKRVSALINGETGEPAEIALVTDQRAILARPGAFCACFAFLFYCAIEYAAGLWASTYFVQVCGVSADVAASRASLFYLGITLGRLAAGFVALKLNGKTILRIGQGFILIGLVWLALPLAGAFRAAALLLVGLGCAPIFPTILDLTPKLFGARYAQGLMGLMFAFAYLGSALIAPLFGWLSPYIGVRAWPYYLLLLVCGLVFCSERMLRRAKTT